MLYHDFLKTKFLELINLEFLKKKFELNLDTSSIVIEIPNNKKFGDVSTNIAMIFAKKLDTTPRLLAEKLSKELNKNINIEKLEVVGPGFLNMFFSNAFWQKQLKELVSCIESYNYKIEKKKFV